MTIAPEKTTLETGRVVAIAGPVVDVEFPPHSLPEINHAVEMDIVIDGVTVTVTGEVAQQIGEGRVRCVCMKPTDGLVRGAVVRQTGRGITVPVGDAVLGHVFNVIGEPLDTDDIGPVEDRWEIHRNAPAFDQLEPRATDVRDRHQGHRPARPLRPGRQDRPLRRRRRGQDRPDHGDDPSRGRAARGRVGLRRRGRAHPRGHRPAARDARVRRHREDRPGLRPDGRAAGGAPARRAGRPDHGRVLPRREEPGRAVVRRQHLPLRAGGLGGLDAARAHAERGGLPADARRRDGRAPRAHHLDAGPLDHVAAGRLRARRTTTPTRRRSRRSPTSTPRPS